MKRYALIFICAAAIVGLVAAVFPHLPSAAKKAISNNFSPFFPRASNCGGNTAANAVCMTLTVYLRAASEEAPENTQLLGISSSNKQQISSLAHSSWVPGARFLVKKAFTNNLTPRQIVVVCDKAYNNVPQPTIWNLYHKNPAHAVGYSDLTTGLISPEEFKKLDLREFIDAAQLATNSIQKASL